jgi:hypothetical protein
MAGRFECTNEATLPPPSTALAGRFVKSFSFRPAVVASEKIVETGHVTVGPRPVDPHDSISSSVWPSFFFKTTRPSRTAA